MTALPSLTFWAEGSQVYMADGPWSVRLTESQCDQLLCIWEDVNAVEARGSLSAACEKAGHVPRVSGLRVVVDNTGLTPREVVRGMLKASRDHLTTIARSPQEAPSPTTSFDLKG
jgi:hypothetical protein